SDMVLALESVGVRIEVHHHEVATGGQTEVDMRYDTLTKMADKVMWYKYCAKNTARKWGKTATFMPKPLFQDNGSGMHTHQSLWKNGKNLFFERGGYADISKNCLYYIGGILKHAPALLAIIAPSTNSYKRLVPGYEAPINLVYSQRNRSACVRIPGYSKSEGAKRIEFRTPDNTCNPYLSFAACLMAGAGRGGRIRVARVVGGPELNALGPFRLRVHRDAHARRAVALAVREVDRRLVTRHESAIGVGRRRDDRAKRRRVLEDPTDVIETGLRDVG